MVEEDDNFYEENNDGSTGDDVDDDVISASKKEFLKFYGLKEICIGTVYRWMTALGIKYDSRKKNYYVDCPQGT